MKAELRSKWLAALRSGEIKQGDGQLGRRDTKMCCLGVLCHVQGQDMNEASDEENLHGDDELTYIDYYEEYRPKPWYAREFPSEGLAAGLTKEQCTILASMNDGKSGQPETKKTFDEIADWIEENIDATA